MLVSVLFCEHAMAVDEVYMFSYFRDPDGVDGMHLAYSLDGLSYHAVNGDVAVTMPGKGPDGTTTTIMRDPHISQGPDGIFHLTYTTSWGYNSTRERAIPHLDTPNLPICSTGLPSRTLML